MKNILALVGSNNPNSLNKKLIEYVTTKLPSFEVNLKDWEFFEIPIYSLAQEKERGFPADIRVLQNNIKDCDGLLIAVSEQNKSISAFFKNILDWMSRLDPQFLEDKKILLMSTSADENASVEALNYMKKVLPIFGGEIVESFSIANFSDNFNEDNQLKEDFMFLGLLEVLTNFEQHIDQ